MSPVGPLWVDVPLRWGDMDAQGHVNNAGIVDYLQEARVDFLLIGEKGHLLEGGVVVTRHEVVYKRPIVFSEPAGAGRHRPCVTWGPAGSSWATSCTTASNCARWPERPCARSTSRRGVPDG